MTSCSDHELDENAEITTEYTETRGNARRLVWLAFLGILLVAAAGYVLWRWGAQIGALFQDQDQVREWLAQFGALGPLVSILLNIAQVLLAPIPGQVIGLANGYLYGVIMGTLYSLIGVMLGTAIAMVLGRVLGRPVVERFVSAEHLDRWDSLATKRGPLVLFFVFLLPLLPDDIVAFAVGLSPISIPYALILAAVGRLPGLVVSSWVGANATSLSPAGWVAVGVSALALGALVLRFRARLESAMLRLIDRLGGRSAAG
jgi:uncharacterized membrane protein YdjX (TVP38/TMEM64 family)